MAHQIKVALAGNPNCGKSTLFNALTGAHQHVGNWPGKTVEKKSGFFRVNSSTVEVIDLPGTYSLSPYSQEEVIARDYIIEQQPDVIVSVVDSSNLERNLYLTSQVMELEKPVIVALNMVDMAENRGICVDGQALARCLGIPVVPMVAVKNKGLDHLLENIRTLTIKEKQADKTTPILEDDQYAGLHLGKEIEKELSTLQDLITAQANVSQRYPARWLALKLMEQDSEIFKQLGEMEGGIALIAAAQQALQRLQPLLAGEDFETLAADRRYSYINNIVKVVSHRSSEQKITLSDRIDRIATHKWLGIPIFLTLMWIVFKLTTDIASPFLDWVDGVINGPFTRWVVALLSALGLSETWVESLFLNGIIAGVGNVLVFVPVLMALYLALAILEDSGYMARAAFVMDRLMRALGLHGKSFLPMIVGFGCTVPALYATRTLENEKDRILTGLLVPFMSCGARLPVYVLFAAIFFPQHAGWVIFGLYVLGIVVAILMGLLLRNTLFKESERMPFVMELPPYRLPNLKGVWTHMWERTGSFVRKAWTIILATSIVVWVLMAVPVGGGNFAQVDAQQSAFAALSGAISPLFAPAGFGSWEASGALVTGFVAKEVVISTLSQVYGMEAGAEEEEAVPSFGEDLLEIGTGFVSATGDAIKAIPGIVGIQFGEAEEEGMDNALMQTIRGSFTATSAGHAPLAGLAYMVFVLLYTPCMVAVAAARQELGNRWMWFSVIGQFALAWVISTFLFQFGKLLGIG